MTMSEFWNDILTTLQQWWNFTAPKIWKGISEWWISASPAIINAVIILILGLWLTRILIKLIRRALKRGKTDVGVQQFTVSLLNTILKGIVFITAASSLGVNVTSIVAALGAAGVTAGLAVKDSLSNFVSGVTLLYARPFKVGDYISFDTLSGTVLEIQLMATSIQTPDNKRIVIPNSHLTSKPVTNFTAEDARRAEFSVVLACQSDAEKAMALLHDVFSQNEKTQTERPVDILITSLDETGIHVTAFAWCQTGDLSTYQHEIWKRIQADFEKHGLLWPRNRMDIKILEKSTNSTLSVD